MDEHCLSFDNGFCYLFLLLFMWHSRGTKPEVLLASTSWCCTGSVLYYHYPAWNHGFCEPPCFKKGKHKHLLRKSLSTQFEKWERQQSLAFFKGTSEQPPAPAVLITTEKLAVVLVFIMPQLDCLNSFSYKCQVHFWHLHPSQNSSFLHWGKNSQTYCRCLVLLQCLSLSVEQTETRKTYKNKMKS